MRIDIKTISRSKEAFIEIETELDPDDLAVSIQDYRLIGPLSFTGRLQAAGDGVFALNGRLTAAYEGECARCLIPVQCRADVALKETYRPAAAPEEGEVEDSYRYEGYTVDILPAIRDNLVLALPQRLLCRDDCRGLCPICGANLNEKTCGCAEVGSSGGSPFDQLKNLL